MKSTKLASAACIAIGLLALGLCIRSGIKSITDSQRTVEVRGLATREVPANQVTWPIVFTQVGNNLPAVYDKVSDTNDQIVSFLTDNGIPASEISISAPTVTDLEADRYRSTPIPFKYSLTSVVTVSSKQVEQVRALINRQGELLKRGIPISTDNYQYQVSYDYTELNSIKPEMIAEATDNARQAAKKFAEDSDSEVGKIKSALQGQFSIDNRDSYTPHIKTVRVVTYLTYFIED